MMTDKELLEIADLAVEPECSLAVELLETRKERDAAIEIWHEQMMGWRAQCAELNDEIAKITYHASRAHTALDLGHNHTRLEAEASCAVAAIFQLRAQLAAKTQECEGLREWEHTFRLYGGTPEIAHQWVKSLECAKIRAESDRAGLLELTGMSIDSARKEGE